MNDFLKNKLMVLAKLASTVIMMIILVWALKFAPNHEWHLGICVVFTGLVLLWSWLANKFKKPIVLTDEERQRPIENELDLSNTIDWFPIVSWSILFILAWNCFLPAFSVRHWKLSDLIFVPIYLAVMLPFFFAPRRNKYIIQDNTLIVQEFDLFHMTTDMRIPIDTIDKVYISDIITLTPRLIIVVNGIERKLRCTTHTKELAEALCQRMK